ncbi:MAG TPA: hypothetical protein DCR24_06805 [Bacillus bacterium]|nr:hypothetical protein [Bacillus sp. (in: firmicutes)]
MEFIKSNIDMIEIEMEIMNSHPEYNLLADGKRLLEREDMIKEHEEEKALNKERYLVKIDESFIGIVDFIMENPRDCKPWLGLFIIHSNWTKKSYAVEALAKYEQIMKDRNIKEVRLGCFAANTRGMYFWEKNGYQKVKEMIFKDKALWVMEKEL